MQSDVPLPCHLAIACPSTPSENDTMVDVDGSKALYLRAKVCACVWAPLWGGGVGGTLGTEPCASTTTFSLHSSALPHIQSDDKSLCLINEPCAPLPPLLTTNTTPPHNPTVGGQVSAPHQRVLAHHRAGARQ